MNCRLPHVDEHIVPTHASRSAVWSGLIDMLRKTMGPHRGFVTIMNAKPRDISNSFTGSVGDTLPGFRVVTSEPARKLVLEGQHRFSRYRLTFVIDEGQLRAITDATFPGVKGRVYRSFIIGSTAHRFFTRRMLKQAASAAERH
jgi:hypothetical protein